MVKRTWPLAKEKAFLDVWYNNLSLMHGGKPYNDACKELKVELEKVNIYINSGNLKTKMDKLKRKYLHIMKENLPRTTWDNFELMDKIMVYESKDNEMHTDLITEDISCGTINSVHEDEKTATLANNEDKHVDTTATSAVDSAPIKSRLRMPSVTYDKFVYSSYEPKAKRRIWSQADEDIFVDVWQAYVRDLESSVPKQHAFMRMEERLQSLGIEISSEYIKLKMNSLIRKFRGKKKNATRKWINYAKVGDILAALEAIQIAQSTADETMESYSFIDDLYMLFNDDSPPEVELTNENGPPAKKLKKAGEADINDSEETDINDSKNPSIRAASQEPQDIELAVPSDKKDSKKTEIINEFTELVNKELSSLNDDLLIEAKRQIYNVICCMQMKQLSLVKNSY